MLACSNEKLLCNTGNQKCQAWSFLGIEPVQCQMPSKMNVAKQQKTIVIVNCVSMDDTLLLSVGELKQCLLQEFERQSKLQRTLFDRFVARMVHSITQNFQTSFFHERTMTIKVL